ncbi:MAG TPA: RNA polymerase sigma factor [Polyangia bacterium]|jgi:RNA polymerase sigma-70 factor (ECF subfamily)|nr:RNA polymerase sigma factor [Polyangia bacterium]
MRLNAQRTDPPALSDDAPAPCAPRDADEACLNAFQEELDYVHRTLARLGAQRSDIDDLLQDVFLALRSSWSRCDKSRPLRPYLFGIAFRIFAAHRRKRSREVPFGIVDLPDAGIDPDAGLQKRQARRLLLAALDRVPLPRRAVLIMHELDDIPVTEVASVLHVRKFTVYSRLRKGRRELVAALRQVMNRGAP